MAYVPNEREMPNVAAYIVEKPEEFRNKRIIQKIKGTSAYLLSSTNCFSKGFSSIGLTLTA
jgi:hypothetical protein